MDLHVLSGGAAQGVVKALAADFANANGAEIKGTFGAVGLMKEKLILGEPCDVAILTAALINELAQGDYVQPGTITNLGKVKTGIAVRDGDAQHDVSNPEQLKQVLLSASEIYFPDPEKATAGIHFANVLRRLGIYDQVAPRLRPHPNGATAMRHLAQDGQPNAIGCTQVTEILYTDGVRLVDSLPPEFELATTYTAAVCTKSTHPELSARLVQLLGSKGTENLRRDGGFEL
ncbi:molybdate transport system substrate-binding protein [Noviherbaspirillum humi]|uniref:Molybdate transport system substrate-binding protein n=1 Tax=Noviherbaspirillum humi TaxID=1688639 RepID=A0A239FGJ7_9BURK|nr:substrate-binding domain-containing protein [Noviherbaspirillum humi]SNS56140.1 molybdate transport system substrate-binding protein [Noviherbaspirillum humi]